MEIPLQGAIIDCDSHIVLRDSMDNVDDMFAELKPVLQFDERGHFVERSFPGRPPESPLATPATGRGTGTNYDGMADMEARIRDFEKMGITHQVILPQFTDMRWSYRIEPNLGTAMAHSYNLAVTRVLERHPGRFLGVALVAAQDVARSIEELKWAHREGFKAVVLDYTFPVDSHPYGETLGEHRELWPFFAVCEELEMPVYVHATQHGHRAMNLIRFQRIGLDYFAPHDSHMNLASFITSGLLDDFPGLRIIHTESGTGFIKPLAEGLDANMEMPKVNYDEETDQIHSRRKLPRAALKPLPMEEMMERNKELPSSYFRKNFYFTIETEESELVEAIAFLGAEHLLFATDYPHNDPGGSMKWRDTTLLASNPHLSEVDKDAIRYQNAAKLFHLDVPVPAGSRR